LTGGENELYEKGKLQTLGVVEKAYDDASQLRIFPQYCDALNGVTSFSHIIVLYWLHKRDEEEKRRTLIVTPMMRRGAPEVGVFASRSPDRPNPIGLSVVELLTVEGCVLRVQKLDAYEGTPIIDIKPYIPGADCVTGARAPEWTLNGPEK
jgi:tRNA-Thr(GGU) m(6)t(6)A37 methyltransferase TsaA